MENIFLIVTSHDIVSFTLYLYFPFQIIWYSALANLQSVGNLFKFGSFLMVCGFWWKLKFFNKNFRRNNWGCNFFVSGVLSIRSKNSWRNSCWKYLLDLSFIWSENFRCFSKRKKVIFHLSSYLLKSQTTSNREKSSNYLIFGFLTRYVAMAQDNDNNECRWMSLNLVKCRWMSFYIMGIDHTYFNIENDLNWNDLVSLTCFVDHIDNLVEIKLFKLQVWYKKNVFDVPYWAFNVSCRFWLCNWYDLTHLLISDSFIL